MTDSEKKYWQALKVAQSATRKVVEEFFEQSGMKPEYGELETAELAITKALPYYRAPVSIEARDGED